MNNIEQGVHEEIRGNRDVLVEATAAIDRMREAVQTQTLAEEHRGDREKERDEFWIQLDIEQTERLNDTLESLTARVSLLSQIFAGIQTALVQSEREKKHEAKE